MTHISELKPDGKNARRHNARNIGMIAESLQQFGANRGIVIDEEGTVLAGNGVLEAAAQAGIESVRVVETDGHEIIAVRVRHLSDDQKRQYAVADNRTGDLSGWDTAVLKELNDDGLDLSSFFFEDELARLIADVDLTPEPNPAPVAKDDQKMVFLLTADQERTVREALDYAKDLGPYGATGNEDANGNALARVAEIFLGSVE